MKITSFAGYKLILIYFINECVIQNSKDVKLFFQFRKKLGYG